MTSIRGMGLLRSRVNMYADDIYSAKFSSVDLEDCDDTLLDGDWRRWRHEERCIRLAWSVFEYDCSLCTLTNRRGAVDLHELPTRLPCPEAIWDAPSAQAWNALIPSQGFGAQGHPLPLVLRGLVSQSLLPSDLPAWSKRLCAQIIGRLLWDLKRIELASISEYLGLPSLKMLHQPTYTVLLDRLITIRNLMVFPSNTTQLIHAKYVRFCIFF